MSFNSKIISLDETKILKFLQAIVDKDLPENIRKKASRAWKKKRKGRRNK